MEGGKEGTREGQKEGRTRAGKEERWECGKVENEIEEKREILKVKVTIILNVKSLHIFYFMTYIRIGIVLRSRFITYCTKFCKFCDLYME